MTFGRNGSGTGWTAQKVGINGVTGATNNANGDWLDDAYWGDQVDDDWFGGKEGSYELSPKNGESSSDGEGGMIPPVKNCIFGTLRRLPKWKFWG